MKREARIFLLILMYVVGFSNLLFSQQQIEKAKWLIGLWENKTPRGNLYESWRNVGSNEFLGKSYTVKSKDTTVFEKIRLVQQHDTLFYIPTVSGQNSGLPVRFSSTFTSDTKLIFENQTHNFPQIITYEKINPDSLVAEVSGFESGKARKETYPMKRVKNTRDRPKKVFAKFGL